jgi:hypothetical protein
VPLARLRPEQVSPELQVPVLPVPQQDSPEAPQVLHWLPPEASTHSRDELQAGTPPSRTGPPVPQQSWPEPPHGSQVPGLPCWTSRPEHAKPVLHVALLVPQQGCPEPPQVVQMLPEDLTTQDPALQGVAPEQQAWPSPPQGLQVPALPCWTSRPEHEKPVLQVALLVPQQGCPEPPQVVQMLPEDLITQDPALHGVAPEQQA